MAALLPFLSLHFLADIVIGNVGTSVRISGGVAPPPAVSLDVAGPSLGLDARRLAGPGAGTGQGPDRCLREQPAVRIDALRLLLPQYQLDDVVDAMGPGRTGRLGAGVMFDAPVVEIVFVLSLLVGGFVACL